MNILYGIGPFQRGNTHITLKFFGFEEVFYGLKMEFNNNIYKSKNNEYEKVS